MDEEDTRDYREPCPQCSEVNWGLTDERKFYCKSCHTVIEKTKDLDESETFSVNAKVQSINRGLKRKKKSEKGWLWYICEGFQFILLKQAEALRDLGVDPRIKDDVMWSLWRRYLQKTNQAYTKSVRGSQTTSESDTRLSESDSELESFSLGASSVSESDGEYICSTIPGVSSAGEDTSASESAVSVMSGSVDGGQYVRHKKCSVQLTMPLTLAFCYLSLLWLREPITLSDLLRFVFREHIPYAKAEQYIPEKIKIYGADIHIFQVQSLPEHKEIMQKTTELAYFLDLPRFPPITNSCFLHPNVLCMKYLMEVNLPDELHLWTTRLAVKVGLDDITALTFDPMQKKKKIRIHYDIQAAALIIVTLKLLFILDDHAEWGLSSLAKNKNDQIKEKNWFEYKSWYKTMKVAIDEAQQQLVEEQARFMWKSDKTLYYRLIDKPMYCKRKQMAQNLQRQFSKLAEPPAADDAGKQRPSSFLFNWEDENTGKTCFHGHSLEGITQQNPKVLLSRSKRYWLSSLKKCNAKDCKHWTKYEESNFPKSYHFVLSLFSFLLKVELCVIHHEVCAVEDRLYKEHSYLFTKKLYKKRRKSTKKTSVSN
ncbi:TATA box-binding protein-associated factor RNA polymerase I subunit B [Pelodytes ibericus]